MLNIKENIPPVLSGQSVELRPFTEDNLTDEYVQWLNDPNVMQYSEQRHKYHTIESCKAYYHSMRINKHLFWAIVEKMHNKHIGNLSAYIDHPNRVADLAILIGNSTFQGQGLGRTSWQLASEYLLNSVKMRKITAGTMASNQRMLNIMWSTGMIQEGCRPRQFIMNGEEIDLILASKFREHAQDESICK